MTSQLSQGFSLGSVDIHPAAGLVTDAAGTRRLSPRSLRVLVDQPRSPRAGAQHGRLVDPEVSNTCGGNGYVQITLHYGDSLLRLTPPVIKLPQNEGIRFRLNPDKEYSDPENIDYNKVLVVVTGGEGSWINTRGEHGGNRKPYLSLCVPEGLEKIT